MKLPHFFIERPIFAAVLSIIVAIVGALSYPTLPTAQYPDIAPPNVAITASYPGASAETLAETVATPIEQAVNGVENMIYMTSSSTANGDVNIGVYFKQGTDVNQAQVLVQNRVTSAEPRLPEEVRRIGIQVERSSPDLLMVVFFRSPDRSLDLGYIGNYLSLQVIDKIARVPGVAAVRQNGGRDYNMRIWIDPGLAAARDMTVDEVVAALREQNVQVAAGSIGKPPYGKGAPAFELGVQTQGRLTTPEQFGQVIVKRDATGRLTRVRDVARVEIGAQDYGVNSYIGNMPAVAMGVTQLPGSNALETAANVQAALKEASKDFPPGLIYKVDYNPTTYIAESISAVEHTLFEAIVLVSLVVLLFLQSWRAAIIPIIAIPISLIGSMAVLAGLGYSLNSLSLFGLVLAIGIVVDDAIVVIENVERLMEQDGLSPREAAHETMKEVSGALIAIALVLIGVFLPTAFIPGISGMFYQQFAVTISSATVISALVSLTLSPALAALLLRPRVRKEGDDLGTGWRSWGPRFARSFNSGFDKLSDRYGRFTARAVRMLAVVGIVYAILILVAGWRFVSTPTGFIPAQDQGYLISVVQLPPGSSLQRTDEYERAALKAGLKVKGIASAGGFAGVDGSSFTSAPNAGVIFWLLEPKQDREQTAGEVQAALSGELSKIPGGDILIVTPPPVNGIGTGGGFKMMIEDRGGKGYQELAKVAGSMMMAANQIEPVAGAFALFNTGTPRLTADIDRDRAERMGVPVGNVFSTLNAYLGSAYVNDFNFLGRTYRVTAQADAPYRDDPSDIYQLKTRSASGAMVPMSSVVTLKDDAGPYRVIRYNLYPAAELQGDSKPGYSSGETLRAMEELAAKTLPEGFDFEWTELAFQQKQAGNTGMIAFGLAVVFVFLLLSALYESLVLPLAVILIVPMCLLAAILGVNAMGMDNNILTQIGLVVLIGLAAKNAILIVEFARQGEDEGLDPREAAVHASHQRLRPILMTSIAFILGVLPLVISSGAGSEMRQALGVAVFFGMIGVTIFGLLFTPSFYVISRKFGDWAARVTGRGRQRPGHVPAAETGE